MTHSASLRRWIFQGALIGLATSLAIMAIAGVLAWRSGSSEYLGAAWMVLFGLTFPWSLTSQWLRDFTTAGAWLSVVVLAPMLQAALVALVLRIMVQITRHLTRSQGVRCL